MPASATATGSVSSISLPPTTLQPIDSVTSSSGGLLAEISSKETSYVHHIGNLKELGLDFGWGPTAIVEFILEHIHVWAGTPWLASMSLTAIALRLSLAYLHAKSIDASARATALSPITKKIQEKMKEGQRVGDQAIVMEAKGELQGVFKTAGIKKRHLFAFTLIQLPLGYGTFRLLRSMADKRVPGLEDGGILWFQDLTIMDPYLILPLLSGALTYIIIKASSERSLGLPFPPEKPKGIIGGAISEIKGMIAEGKRTANKISGTSAATGKKSASDLKRATAFEKKRKSELDQLRWDNEAHSRRKWHEKKGAQAHKTRDSSRA
ncbi:MAG: Mitochondrial inner membrane protein oxa1 [Trizodia sp. TS-e1964]|nr:MAG: Mitochondrial inner membrane protein oxa1 [Trizodia sp. TS-e1964]